MLGYVILVAILVRLYIAYKNHTSTFKKITNNYQSVSEVMDAFRKAGCESSNLIVGIDYTASNEQRGQKSFDGKSLHYLSSATVNPYENVIYTMGHSLEQLDEDRIIPVFGFGDSFSKGRSVIPITGPTGAWCVGFEEVIAAYRTVTPQLKLGGPTNFAPLINKALELVNEEGHRSYHILLIVTDGQVSDECQAETVQAIVKASEYPLSIVVVGVGDGPWDEMEKYDDELPERKFDNFQFVNYHRVVAQCDGDQNEAFALQAMMELPDQYKAIRDLKLFTQNK